MVADVVIGIDEIGVEIEVHSRLLFTITLLSSRMLHRSLDCVN